MKITLKKLTNDAYTTAASFWKSNDAKNIQRDYFNYVYTSCLDYIDTGDVNVLNRLMAAAKISGHVRITNKLIVVVASHPVIGGKYKGKARIKRLKTVRANRDKLKATQEGIINTWNDKKEIAKREFNVESTTSRAINALATLMAHDVDFKMEDILVAAREKKDSVDVKKVVSITPEVEERQVAG